MYTIACIYYLFIKWFMLNVHNRVNSLKICTINLHNCVHSFKKCIWNVYNNVLYLKFLYGECT